MAKETEKKSNLPFLIIGVVLVVAVVAGAYFLRPKATPAPNTARNTANQANAAKPENAMPPGAPTGANPPNMFGSATAAVTLEEFADFQCASCAMVHPVMNDIKSLYGSKIKFVFRNFPLAMHDKAYDAAVAAEAAGMQGKFWDMQNVLFNNQRTWTSDPNYKTTWKALAGTIGLDVAKWEDDMRGMATRQRVNDDMARGRAANIGGTPALFINGTFIEIGDMNVDALKVKIDAELQKALKPKDQAPPQNQNAAANAGNTNK
jgi:protein-disulfide isomerase